MRLLERNALVTHCRPVPGWQSQEPRRLLCFLESPWELPCHPCTHRHSHTHTHKHRHSHTLPDLQEPSPGRCGGRVRSLLGVGVTQSRATAISIYVKGPEGPALLKTLELMRQQWGAWGGRRNEGVLEDRVVGMPG